MIEYRFVSTRSKKELSNDKECLLEFLRYFDKKEGRIPKQEDFVNNPKYPGFVTIVKWFGSWNNASKLSGLVNIFTNYTDEELLEFLIKFERKEGRIPRQEDFIGNPNCPSHNLYKSRFGSWNNAIKCAGLIPGQYISNEE